jgi:hypothetical protein
LELCPEDSATRRGDLRLGAVAAPPDAVGGRYCEDCHVADVVAPGVQVGPMGPGVASYAVDPGRAAALWAKSEDMVGECY